MPRFIIAAVFSCWSLTAWAVAKPSCADFLRTQPLNLLVAEIYNQPLDQENSLLLEFKTRESNIHSYVDQLKTIFRKRSVKVKLHSVVLESNEFLVGVQVSGKGKQLLHALIDLKNLTELDKNREEIVWVARPASANSASIMRRPIPELNLPRALARDLLANDIYFVGDLVALDYRELTRLSRIGPAARNRIIAALEEVGLKPGTAVPGWPYSDIDPFGVRYPPGQMPQIPTWLWRDAEKKNVRSILSRSLKFSRPVIVLYNPEGPLVDPSGMIALINDEFFEKNGPAEIVHYLESQADIYTRSDITFDLARKLALWKEQGIASFEAVPVGHLVNDDSPEWVASVGRSRKPLRMELGDRTVLVIPLLPR